MVAISLFIFFCLMVLAIFPPIDHKQRIVVYAFWGGVLVCFAGFRPMGSDMDSSSYLSMFDNSSLSNWGVEPAFNIIVYFVRDLLKQDITLFFVVFAIIGVWVKMSAIKRLTDIWFLSLLIYFSYFFLAHEYTQIRAGISTGLFLLSIPALSERKIKTYLWYFCLALLFHYSAILMLPIWFVARIKSLWLKVGIIPFAYLLYLLDVKITVAIPIESIQVKLNAYEVYVNSTQDSIFNTISVFKPFLLLKIALYYYLLYFIRDLTVNNKYFPTLLNLFGVSIFLYVIFHFMPPIATRVSEFIGVVEIIIIPMLYYTIKPAIASRLIVSLISLVFYFILVFNSSYIT